MVVPKETSSHIGYPTAMVIPVTTNIQVIVYGLSRMYLCIYVGVCIYVKTVKEKKTLNMRGRVHSISYSESGKGEMI